MSICLVTVLGSESLKVEALSNTIITIPFGLEKWYQITIILITVVGTVKLTNQSILLKNVTFNTVKQV